MSDIKDKDINLDAIIEMKQILERQDKDIATLSAELKESAKKDRAEFLSVAEKIDKQNLKLARDMNWSQIKDAREKSIWLSEGARDSFIKLMEKASKERDINHALTVESGNEGNDLLNTELLTSINTAIAQHSVALQYCNVVQSNNTVKFGTSEETGGGADEAFIDVDGVTASDDISSQIVFSVVNCTPKTMIRSAYATWTLNERSGPALANEIALQLVGKSGRKVDWVVANSDADADRVDGGFTGFLNAANVNSVGTAVNLANPDLARLHDLIGALPDQAEKNQANAFYCDHQTLRKLKAAKQNSEVNGFIWAQNAVGGPRMVEQFDGYEIRRYNQMPFASATAGGNIVFGDLASAVGVVIGSSLSLQNPYRQSHVGLIQWDLFKLFGTVTYRPVHLAKVATTAS